MTQLRFEQKLRAGFACALLLALVIGTVTYRNTRDLIQLGEQTRRTRDVIMAVDQTLSTLKDAETGQRGYLLTGRAEYLAPFRLARARLDKHLNNLQDLTASDPVLRGQAAQIRGHARRKMTELALTVRLRRTEGFVVAREVVLTDGGKREMDAVRALAAAMTSRKMEEWGALSARRDAVARGTQKAVGALIASEGALLLFAYGLIRREGQARAEAARQLEAQNAELEAQNAELEAQQEQLARTSRGLEEANALLEQASHRFQELFQGLPVACYCYDSDGRIMEWNRAFAVLYGWDSSELFQERICHTIHHAQDASRLREITARVFAGESVEGLAWDSTRSDGSRICVQSSTFPLRAAGGAIVGAISADMDITDRREAEEALHTSEERLRALTAITSSDALSFDQKIERLLHLGCAQFGLESGLLAAVDGGEYTVEHAVGGVAPGLRCRLEDTYCREVLRTGRPVAVEHAGASEWDTHPGYAASGLETYIGTPVEARGRAHGALCFVGPTPRADRFTAADREFIHLMGQWIGVEIERRQHQRQLEENNARLEMLATTDGLTGLKNHRTFQEQLAAECARAGRYGDTLSLVMLDVDHFKRYNDAFGHPAGDDVLRRVATILRDAARDTDLAARYGGEEFVVILPHTDGAGAEAVAERLRQSVAGADWPHRPVTASFGAATLTPGMAGASDLIAAADRALYRAKAAGRDRVFHAAAPEDLPVGGAS